MKTTSLLSAAALTLVLSAGGAFAQGNSAHFFDTWDADKDGKVTVAEVETRRSDIFTSFDANNDGFLIEEETKLMDEMRDNQQEMNQEDGGMQGMGQGQGQGMGHGKHKGMGGQGMMGKGKMGQGKMGQGAGEPGHGPNGHMGFDTDQDGKVSKAEFIGQSKTWLAKFDRNGDGDVTSADFGQ